MVAMAPAPSPDTQAILLLCARLPGQERSAVKPFSPAQYRDVARLLHQQDLRPGDLLLDKGRDALAELPDTATRDRITSLLERGAALAMAMERWGQTGIWVLSRADSDYPEGLKKNLGRLAPPILFGSGPTELLSSGGVAIVGSRNADQASFDFARKLGQRCATEELTVISGGARGVDSEATLACLDGGGTGLAVLAEGLAKAVVAKKYREHLAERRLLLLSPYSPHASFSVGNAMGRNKYLYILADVAVVVHTGSRGGTWEGAHENLKKNWTPLLVCQSDDPKAANTELLRAGGHPLPHHYLDFDDSIHDILGLRDRTRSEEVDEVLRPGASDASTQSNLQNQLAIPLGAQTAEQPSPSGGAQETQVQPATARLPREGMQARIRNRRGLIASVDPFDAHPEGRLHLVRVEYTDRDGTPEDTVIWEREPGATVLEPHALPKVGDDPPMPPEDFDALVRATRWSSLTPFLKPDGSGERAELPIAAPFFGAVQVDDFQLVPLLQALQMPRVSLLLADDVGLGKTIEAGLILTELLIRRRIRRVLVISPASLRNQWRKEMHDKFSLSFDVIDRPETHSLQKKLGLDANPWRTFPRIITSYYYLRQPDVLQEFLATCHSGDKDGQLAQLPWDLLIVDEAHNLMPSNFGDDSDLAKMLRTITPWFEHKLFLTATPHNGHTRCFSGLLEQLDPVRFTQTAEFSEEEKERVRQIVVRRLKSEINTLDDEAGRPRRFPYRELTPLALKLSSEEKALSQAVETLRKRVKALVRSAGKRGEELAGNFAVEVLSKRLLSSPATFAESWHRLKLGLAEDEKAEALEVNAAKRAAEEELDDDLEREGRAQHAARTIGAWLQPLLGELEEEIAAVDRCLSDLGLEAGEGATAVPRHDSRFDQLKGIIEERLRDRSEWRDDERLIIFTEYKTTLDNLEARLKKHFSDDGDAIKLLYGGMSAHERDPIQEGFNDPADPVRVLIATDAASEGLNLQKTARFVLHYEIPWNPSRLEQRNGRLDRHGQARDVEVFHFTSEDDADLRFIAHVVNKVHNIREDLGSMGEVFDSAFQRRFLDAEDADRVIADLDLDIKAQAGQGQVERQETEDTGALNIENLAKLCRDIDLSPDSLRDTLEIALGWGVGRPRLEGPDARGRLKLVQPLPPRWESLIDDSLRLETEGASRGRLPKLIFDPQLFIETNGGRPVFRSSKDTVLLHLGHPIFHQALSQFAQARFPGGTADQATRWVVRSGDTPSGAQALLLLTVEELAVNRLREPLHQWVRTLRIPIADGKLGETLPHQPPGTDRSLPIPTRAFQDAVDRASDLWLDVRQDLQRVIQKHQGSLSRQIHAVLETAGKEAVAEETQRFKHRLAEVEKAMQETNLKKLERERDKLLEQMQQLVISQEQKRFQETELRNLEDELARRRSHYQELLELLQRDQERVIKHMLPHRYSLQEDSVQVYPVAVEIRLPEVSS